MEVMVPERPSEFVEGAELVEAVREPPPCRVNGEVRQESNTGLMIYPIDQILVYVTQFMTLLPGDLILTGTPDGVGPVEPGDVMTVEIDGLGSISNPVAADMDS